MGKLPKEESEAKKIQFGIWLGMPKTCRSEDERTIDLIAAKVGVFRDTLFEWEKDPFVIKIAENAMKFYGANRKKEVIDSMIDKAVGGDVQAAKLYLEWQGEIGAKKADTNIMEGVKVTRVTERT